MKLYATIDEAAIAALTAALPLARRDHWEYGGYILKKGEEFTFTPPYTSRESGAVSLQKPWEELTGELYPEGEVTKEMAGQFRATTAKAGMASSYHIHGCDWRFPDGEQMIATGPKQNVNPWGFSAGDMIGDLLHGFKHGYLAVVCDGKVYRSNYRKTHPLLLLMKGGADGDYLTQILT